MPVGSPTARQENPPHGSKFVDLLKFKINGCTQSTWEPLLTKLVARYLLTEKRRKYALDPVANFHLRNGAEVFRLNYLVGFSTMSL